MDNTNNSNRTGISANGFIPFFVLAAIGLAVIVSYSLGRGSNLWQQVLGGLVTLTGAVLILQKPHWGLAFVIAFVGVTDLLPTSTFVQLTNFALGGATIVAFFLQRKWGLLKAPPLKFTRVHVFGFLFVLWCLISNPSAAVGITTDRNWMMTFVQLFLLLWLSSQILTTPERHRVVMIVFVLAALFSAVSAIQQALETENVLQLVRAVGLAHGSNTATRFFTVAIIFLYSLRHTIKNRSFSLLALIGIVFLVYGVVSTLSRTGILLLGMSFVLLLISDTFGGAGRQISRRRPLMIVAIALLVILLLPPQLFDDLWSRFTAAQTDITTEVRYWLWKAGLEMFQAHPIQGVGIGRFSFELPVYGVYYLGADHLNLGAHNIYIDILAETGIIGSILYGGMIVSSLLAYWHAIRFAPPEQSIMAKTWFIVLVIILLGGLTKQDQYDKLLWMALGVGASFAVPYTTSPTAVTNQATFNRWPDKRISNS